MKFPLDQFDEIFGFGFFVPARPVVFGGDVLRQVLFCLVVAGKLLESSKGMVESSLFAAKKFVDGEDALVQAHRFFDVGDGRVG